MQAQTSEEDDWALLMSELGAAAGLTSGPGALSSPGASFGGAGGGKGGLVEVNNTLRQALMASLRRQAKEVSNESQGFGLLVMQ